MHWKWAAALPLLLVVLLAIGMAHAQVYPSGSVPLNISLSTHYTLVPVGSICGLSGCTVPAQASIEACAYGGASPYYITVYVNNLLNASAGDVRGCYDYKLAPKAAGAYSVVFKATDSSRPSESSTATATIIGVQQSASAPLSPHLSLYKANVNLGNIVPINLTLSGGVAPYAVNIIVNGVHEQAASSFGRYTYRFTPSYAGEYVIQFRVSDASGSNATLNSTIYAIPGLSPSIGIAPLNVSITPSSTDVLPGTPVVVSATASGGTPPYTLELYDSNGTTLATAEAGFISYSYVGYLPGHYYPVTASLSDSAGHTVGSTSRIYTTSTSSPLAYSTLSQVVSPATQVVSVGQPLRFSVAPSGGLPPYYIDVWNSSGYKLEGGFLGSGEVFNYTAAAGQPGTYQYAFETMDSAFGNIYSMATVTVTGYAVPPSQQSGGTISTSVGSTVNIDVAPVLYPCPCKVYVYSNGQFQQVGGVQSSNEPYVYSFLPAQPGSYAINFVVTYAGGASETISYTVNVAGGVSSGGSLLPLLTVSPGSVDAPAGQSRQFSVTASGGAPPYYLVITSGGKLLKSDYIQYGNTPYLYNISESSPGDYQLTFQITDSGFNNAYATANLAVTGS